MRNEANSGAAVRLGSPLPGVEHTEELLDWDTAIEAPPPRRHGSIAVQLRKGGRGKPIPVADPSSESSA